MKLKQFAAVLLLSAATFVGGGLMYAEYAHQNPLTATLSTKSSLFKNADYTNDASNVPSTDFERSAAKASPAVVHIKVLKTMSTQEFNPFGYPSANTNDGSGNNSSNDNNNG
ncbi:MAG: hypothetical protein ABIW47_09630, partial [Ginsengibacter sp.]